MKLLKSQSLYLGEKDELLLNTERILTRCNTVTVSVETPRDTNQTKALETVNKVKIMGCEIKTFFTSHILLKMITLVIDHLHEDVMGSKMRIRAFLNACHPDEVGQIGISSIPKKKSRNEYSLFQMRNSSLQ